MGSRFFHTRSLARKHGAELMLGEKQEDVKGEFFWGMVRIRVPLKRASARFLNTQESGAGLVPNGRQLKPPTCSRYLHEPVGATIDELSWFG